MRFGTPEIVPAGDNSDVFIGTGLAYWEGSPTSALYDDNDSTWASTFLLHVAGESTGRLDCLRFPVVDALHAGDVIPIRMAAPNAFDQGNEGYWQGYLGFTQNSYGNGWIGFTEGFVADTGPFDTSVTLQQDVAAGQVIYWHPYGAGTTGDDFAFEVRTIKFGPGGVAVPPLRLYPRHDKRLYPPTRSRGVRPTGYL